MENIIFVQCQIRKNKKDLREIYVLPNTVKDYNKCKTCTVKIFDELPNKYLCQILLMHLPTFLGMVKTSKLLLKHYSSWNHSSIVIFLV